MKQPKKLTREQKKLVSKAGLNPLEWMCLLEDALYLNIIHKDTLKTKIIDRKKGVVILHEAD